MGNQGFRPNPYIVARFLERLQRGRLKRTQLQMATGLKWSDFSRYLNRLVDLGLLALDDGDGGVYVTERGRELYRSLIEVLGELTF
jgi:predicted transcriptional regulator